MQEQLLPKKESVVFELKLTLTNISLVSFSNHCQNGSISRIQCSKLFARLCINKFIVDEQLKNHPYNRMNKECKYDSFFLYHTIDTWQFYLGKKDFLFWICHYFVFPFASSLKSRDRWRILNLNSNVNLNQRFRRCSNTLILLEEAYTRLNLLRITLFKCIFINRCSAYIWYELLIISLP